MFSISDRIKAFAELGSIFSKVAQNLPASTPAEKTFLPRFSQAIVRAKNNNGWFDAEHVKGAFAAWADQLTEEKLTQWTDKYAALHTKLEPKNVAIIMAGNIPLVGFHDFLSVLLAGHIAVVKMAKDDAQLFPEIAALLAELEPQFANRIKLVVRVENADAVIATGSNNSARYFEAYFGKKPNIIRKNRTSVAVITGSETEDELANLGKDLFAYYGLGCRNVSKIYVPDGFDLNRIFGAILPFKDVINNHKYANNYDYYRAIFMLNKVPFLENGFVLFKEDDSLHTPISVIHYECYKSVGEVEKTLAAQKDELQCVVGTGKSYVPFGQTQQPALHDYADGVDTLEFLISLAVK